MHIRLGAVDLAARDAEAGGPIVIAVRAANLSGRSNLILRAVKWDSPVRAEAGQARGGDVRPDGVLIGPQQRS
jgi:hypothetical protein